jgi:hypothetical protein
MACQSKKEGARNTEKLYKDHPNTRKFLELIKNGRFKCHLRGLAGSSAAMFASTIINNSGCNNIFVLSDKEEAAYFLMTLKPSAEIRNCSFYLPHTGVRLKASRMIRPE